MISGGVEVAMTAWQKWLGAEGSLEQAEALSASWRVSVLGRLAGRLQPWAVASWLMPAFEPFCFLVACLYFVLASQAATAPLGLVLLAMAGLLGVQWLTRGLDVTPVHLPLAVYWGIATLATLLSPVAYVARDGWLKLTLYLLGFLLLHQILRRPSARSPLIGVTLLVSLWMAVYGIRQYFYGAADLATWVDPESGVAGVTRVYSFLQNPNLYGGFLVPLLPWGLAAIISWRGWGCQFLALLITGMNAFCLVRSLSRGAWLGGLAGLGLMGILMVQWINPYLPVRWRRWTIPALLTGSLLVLAVGIWTVEPLRLRFLSIFAGANDTSNNFRLNVWMACLRMIGDFPLLGIGPGNDAFNRVYPLYQQGNYSALGAYSVPLEITLESGLLGILSFSWFVITLGVQGWQTWVGLWQQRHPQAWWVAAGLAASLGMAVHGFVDTVWYRPQVQMLWWLGVALITAPWPVVPSAITQGSLNLASTGEGHETSARPLDEND
ncbi:MAG: IctB family putative bicarbonate transporter [Cyanobacteriota bacterium]|nr:IctB family putative bicarbonate transporter [Cyanobacteriota bacterium]